MQSSLPGIIIDRQSHNFEPLKNLDNITEVRFLELHAAIMRKETKFSDFY